jgi:hypothetical protein
MSDEDYAAALENAKTGRAEPGKLIDWGPVSVSNQPTNGDMEGSE